MKNSQFPIQVNENEIVIVVNNFEIERKQVARTTQSTQSVSQCRQKRSKKSATND